MSYADRSFVDKYQHVPDEALDGFEGSERSLMEKMLRGYSKLRQDVQTNHPDLNQPEPYQPIRAHGLTSEFVDIRGIRTPRQTEKPPRITIPNTLKFQDSDADHMPPINSSRSTARSELSMPSSRPASMTSTATPHRALSATATRAASAKSNRPSRAESSSPHRIPTPGQSSRSRSVQESPDLLFSVRKLSQRPNSANSVILLSSEKQSGAKAPWKDVHSSFVPGPNYRPLSSKQPARHFGPLGSSASPVPQATPKTATKPPKRGDEGKPSERIATNLTPSAKDLSPRRLQPRSRPTSASSARTSTSPTNSRATMELQSSTLSTRQPTPPATAPSDAKPPSARPISAKRSGPRFLPLEVFDNPEYEMFTPQQWLRVNGNSRPLAWSLYHYTNGKTEWKRCYVLGYDEKETSFLIEWIDNGRTKYVKRLNLRFEQESELTFAKRIQEAQELQDYFEGLLRYSTCVESTSSKDIAPLEHGQLDRILKNVSSNFPSRQISLIEHAFQEIQKDYLYAMKKVKFEYRMLDESEQEKVAHLNLPPPPTTSAVPEFGMIQVPAHDFKKCFANVASNLFQANAVVIPYFEALSKLLDRMHGTTFFRLDPPSSPLTLDTFCTIQQKVSNVVRDNIMESWIPDIAELTKVKLQKAFRFVYTEVEQYYRSEFFRFLQLVSYKMDVVLNNCIRESLLRFVQFFEVYRPTAESLAINPFAKNAFWTSHYSSALYSPLFLLKLTVENGKIVFDPSIDSVKNQLAKLFDEVATFPETIPRVDSVVINSIIIPKTYMHSVIKDEADVQQARSAILDIIDKNAQEAEFLLRQYKQYEYLYDQDREKVENMPSSEKSLAELREHIAKHRAASASIAKQSPNELVFGLFSVHCDGLKAALCAQSGVFAEIITNQIAFKASLQRQGLQTRFVEIEQRLSAIPRSAEEWNDMKGYCESIEHQLQDLERDISSSQTAWTILEEFEYEMPMDDFSLFWQIKGWPHRIRDSVNEREVKLSSERSGFVNSLQNDIMDLQTGISELEETVESFTSFGDLDSVELYATQINKMQEDIGRAQENAHLYNTRESLFGFTKSPFPTLAQVQRKLEPFAQLWTIAFEFTKEYPRWMDGPFAELEADKVEEMLTTWRRGLQKIIRTIKEHPKPLFIGTDMKTKLDDFHTHISLFKCLKTPGLRDRHWTQISSLGFPLIKPETINTITFHQIIEMNMESRLAEISEICELAGKEYLFEKSLDMMSQEWRNVEFDCVAYRDSGTHIIRGTDDILSLLDDQIAKTQSMLGSPFIKAFEVRVKGWGEKLQQLQILMEEWLNCQRNYLYLEPIFGSKDILTQMPNEGRKFQTVDGIWRKIMDGTVKSPNVLSSLSRYNILDSFKLANGLLEEIQKGLDEYLETKRVYFPRFYFLSNDELLEILSKTRDPSAVQPHLKKCFENVDRIEIQEEGKVVKLYSCEEEAIPFVPPQYVQTSPRVEEWLLGVEESMRVTLRRIATEAIKDYSQKSREDWILSWPGQVVLAVNKVMWTLKVHEAIREGVRAVREFESVLTQNLLRLVELVRGDLSALSRLALEALIVLDVHGRDVVTKLYQSDVNAEDDFEWMSQMRYYWEDNTLSVRMVNASLLYAYEYLGNTPRLVITPLTDRCYITLVSALSLHYGGAPEGPAGTGKTETTKDLAKALAKQCVVFNCSDGLDYIAMGKFFKGIASSGAWCCFDEFNRIDVEVLSVIAQQILTIQRAIARGRQRFAFEGREIRLDSTCAIFITMNPGYAGRSELPDNLKALFRPVAMMVPDYAMIAEISLLSYGFSDARNLSRKLVATFKLSSEQLSAQHHYDFGMRSVKAVLRAAGSLRRKAPFEREALLVLRAIVDVNVPKFLSDDLPLFQGIIKDLFPGVDVPSGDYKDLFAAMKDAASQMGYQVVPSLMKKCIQIHETIEVRHGVMLVGETYSGKTGCLKMLAAGLSSLSDGTRYFPVKMSTLNPKSVTMGQLYGQFDPVSHEWTDGILADVARQCSRDTTTAKKWVVFDGPVDSIWIENMNSALDDSKKLCLNSGEVIWLTPTMTFIFEVGDLAVASPATVSRCGMIYMEPSLLGWEPLLESWLETLPTHAKPQAGHLRSLFQTFVPPLLQIYKKRVREMVPTLETTLVKNVMSLMECLFKSYTHFPSPAALQTATEAYFIFAVVWSVGATGDADSRSQFNIYFRGLLKSSSGATGPDFVIKRPPPEEGTMYDYMFNPEDGHWVPWSKLASSAQLPEDVPLSEIVVPTTDTVKYSYLLNLYIQNQKPMLFVGPTGTGKTVIMKSLLLSLESKTLKPLFITFSGRTSANQTQDLIDSRLERRRKNIFGPPGNTAMVIMIDDLNMPARETFGAQPVIELLRQYMDVRGWYDRKSNTLMELADIQLVAAMGPPGGGRNPVSSRFLRHFHVIGLTPPEDITLRTIFGSIMSLSLKNYTSSIRDLVVDATIQVYKLVCTQLRPTPAKSHYLFNLRDLSRTFQGIASAGELPAMALEPLTYLWAHECNRVFGDRLTVQDDTSWFQLQIKQVASSNLGVALEPSYYVGDILYGDFDNKGADARKYKKLPPHPQLVSLVGEYLDDYNNYSRKPMSLVLFPYAIQHLARIARILRQPSGHALLIGVEGCGRRSLTRLAAHICEQDVFELELGRTYGFVEWREDLRKLMRRTGLDGRPTVFLLTDQQLSSDAFLEDINNILNTGEVPNLYAGDDLLSLLNDMKVVAMQYNRADSKTQILDLFWSRCRQYMHVIVCMSPVGDSLRNKLRLFPSLVNCCTIDWFHEWPKSALEAVASALLPQSVGDQNTLGLVRTACVRMHMDVEMLNVRYLREVKRHNYVSPTSYMDFLSIFSSFLAAKRQETLESKRRYDNGLKKLLVTGDEVKHMQHELYELQPQLIRLTQETEQLMMSIEKDRVEAATTKRIVEEDEEYATAQADQARKIKEECEADLQEVMPSLIGAQRALETLNKNDVSEVKSMKSPPDGVRKVMEAVCIMLDIKPTLLEGNRMGKKVYDYWESSKKMLSDAKFLQNLQNYDKDNIPETIIEKINPYIKDRSFEPSVMQKVSVAATSLCMWVRAIHRYHKVYKVVAPKKAALKEAEDKFKATMETLKQKKKLLADVEQRIAELLAKYDEAVEKRNELAGQVELCERKLDRAQKLIHGLGGEKDRWTRTRDELGTTFDLLLGDVLISAGIVSYLGPFTATYRQPCIDNWITMVHDMGIPCLDHFSFAGILGDSVRIRQWYVEGLPVDRFSTDNGIIATRTGGRWPLLIDPQGQACKWVKKMESANRLDILKPSDVDIMRRLENAIQFGNPVLIENVSETIEPQLYPVVMKITFKQGGQTMINIGGSAVAFSPQFRLYMTTKLPNPHYKPEICTRVTLVNFVTTPEGVQDQLLGMVVAKEKQELEEEKNFLVVQNANFQREIRSIEDQILGMLSNAEGSFLDDDALIQTLNKAKVTSLEIADKMKQAAETEKKIDVARSNYQPVASRASLLYFCLADMANLEPMYQYSLSWFTGLFLKSIAGAETSPVLEFRLKNLISHFTYSLYRSVCQSLFEKDKLLFSFLLAVRISLDTHAMTPAEWRLFLTGGASVDGSTMAKPSALNWIHDNTWQDMHSLQSIPLFQNLLPQITTAPAAWKSFYDAADGQLQVLPSPYKDKASLFQRLLVVRFMRPDRVVPSVQAFISQVLDSRFIEPPPFDLMKSFSDSDNKTPMIFVLSPGMDPMEEFTSLALKLGFREKYLTISLGQGQGPAAEKMIREASERGRWILLQNCHLAASWMPTLERIAEDLFAPSTVNVHGDFRMWLTSKPTPVFPVTILQNGVKVTNEPPKGLKGNLTRLFHSFDPSLVSTVPTNRQRAFKKLLFGLFFFHAAIQERRRYGALGWNIYYEFSEADLRISAKQLHAFLVDKEPPYKALRYLTGQANYGGRVTDSWDRRLLATMLDDYYTDKILDDKYRFSPSGGYFAPPDGPFQDALTYIQKLPINEKPEIFGLHENADITYAQNETKNLITSLLLLQPRTSSAETNSQEAALSKLSLDLLMKLPSTFDVEDISKRRPIRYEDCMTTVLLQEAIRYNGLLSRIKSSLVDLQNALKGLVVMSPELEALATNLDNSQVPTMWASAAYESRKPLGSWIADLNLRIKFIRDWIDQGPPHVFWLSGFFYPQAFLTGQLQNYARKHKVAIDTVAFDYSVITSSIKAAPGNGCYIEGLFLEGASWDMQGGKLADAKPQELLSPMPTLWLNPYDSTRRLREQGARYACPVYKTSKRSGVLSSTGHSTNYVVTVDLPTAVPTALWIKRGVALLCQTDF